MYVYCFSCNKDADNMDSFLQDLYALQIAKSVSAYCVHHGKACMDPSPIKPQGYVAYHGQFFLTFFDKNGNCVAGN